MVTLNDMLALQHAQAAGRIEPNEADYRWAENNIAAFESEQTQFGTLTSHEDTLEERHLARFA